VIAVTVAVTVAVEVVTAGTGAVDVDTRVVAIGVRADATAGLTQIVSRVRELFVVPLGIGVEAVDAFEGALRFGAGVVFFVEAWFGD
jgi:hypothetical protein